MDEITIKYLSECTECIPVLAQWFFDEWGYLDSEKSVEQIMEELGTYVDNTTIPLAIVAKIEGEAIGTASIVKHDMETHTHLSPWLAGVYVKGEYRRKGVGSILVKRIIEESIKQGIERLYLFTPDMNRFYERLGWKVIEEPVYKSRKVYIMDYNKL